eukprot:Transcript_6046.p1 GENE.Transcript_6046~~Transcript_6046.p1  ORF type:complete len:517 (-),score=162.86 Transcript_6046:113-1663(-)
MPYVPPHLRNKPGGGTDAAQQGGSRSLSDLANAPPPRRMQPGSARQEGGLSDRFQDLRTEPGGRPQQAPDGRFQDRFQGRDGLRPLGGFQEADRSQVARSTRSSQDSRFEDPVPRAIDPHYKHNPKGAPSRFGSAGRNPNKPLQEGEDVPGGVRQDDDGMVYAMPDGTCTYFQDRLRQYPFYASGAALPLLRGLASVNKRVFAISQARIAATRDPEATARQGEHIYVNKPTMKSAPRNSNKGTWSDEEYAHPGMQFLYLRLKSFQRFTESWALFERAAARGIFDPWLQPEGGAAAAPPRAPLKMVSLGGGPGYELLALEWYLSYLAAERRGRAAASGAEAPATEAPPLELVSLDLQPSWEPYLEVLEQNQGVGGEGGGGRQRATYRFGQWNIRSESAIADVLACTSGGPPDLCMVSNVLVYCTDEASADVFATLLDPAKGGVKAVLLNERGGEQKMIELVEKRGVVVVKLLSQESAAGRDDRQLIFLPPGTTPPALSAAGPSTFPNVPYEEAKGGA